MLSAADALLRLALIPGLGAGLAQRLLDAVAQPGEIFSWSMAQLQSVAGITGDLARRLCDPRGEEQVGNERATCLQAGVRLLTRGDADYPVALSALSDPPLVIWMMGELQPRDRLAVAVVGSQRPTAYAHRQAQRLTTGLARLGTTIISGLGRGIDTVAHNAALAGGGRTIAILPSGFSRIYPEENAPLLKRILAQGAVLSELPMAMPAGATSFPRRNRLIAASALATLVVEAGTRCGALGTARQALELGREVLVVPGTIDNPECTGSNQLIRDGATLIAGLEHIIEEVEPLMTLAGGSFTSDDAQILTPKVAALSTREKLIYLLLDDEPRTLADVARIGDLPPSAVSATILSLEARHLVRRDCDGYVRAT